MYGDFMLFEEAGKLEKGERVYLGDVKGKMKAGSETRCLKIQKSFPSMRLTRPLGLWCPFAESFAPKPDRSTPCLSTSEGD